MQIRSTQRTYSTAVTAAQKAKPAKQTSPSTSANVVARRADSASRVGRQVNTDAINTGKLANLKLKLDGIDTAALDQAGQRFRDNAFGPITGNGKIVGSTLDAIKGVGSSHSKNPLDAARDANVRGGGAGHLMQDAGDNAAPPANAEGAQQQQESGSTWDAVKNWFSSVAGSVFGGAGAKTTTGNGGGAAAGTAWSVLTANTESPEAKGNEFRGWASFVKLKNGEYYHPGMNQVDDPFAPKPEEDKTPTPDGYGSSRPTVVTKDDARGINAKVNGRIETVDTGVGRGGPINGGATGAGKVGQRAEIIDGMFSHNVTLNSTLVNGIEARINATINPVNF